MRKTTLILILLVSFMLGACSSQASTPAGGATSTQPVAGDAAGTATQAPQKAVLPPTQTATQPAASTGATPAELANAGCTVQSIFPTPGPTEQSLLPPAGEKDWVQGPDSATTTLIEYSDFQ